MSPEIGQQVTIELERLNHLIAVHQQLLKTCTISTPSPVELSALAAMLHSFYTGIENILKRIEIASGHSVPKTEAWHRQLLERAAQSTPAREAIISWELREALGEYLAFRHVFRQAYSYDLQWEKMSHLVLNVGQTLQRLSNELRLFLRTVDRQP